VFEYKVITETDSRFSGRFDMESLESALNSYAAEGWRVVEAILAANYAKSMKAEVVVILERSTDG
jgi:broad-specificity NMP kinase